MNFDLALEFVLAQEGGLSDDPHDHGGLTKYGISQRAYPDLDIRSLTREDAAALYRRDYWDRCRCDELPPTLRLVVFDAAVNQGVPSAIRLLQRALGVAADGVIGPITLAAAHDANHDALLTELVARRINDYGLQPQFVRYGLGWSRRVAQAHALALRG